MWSRNLSTVDKRWLKCIYHCKNHAIFFLGTFGDLRVFTDAPAQGQGDIGKIGSRVGQALSAAVRRRAAYRLGRLGSRASPHLHPVFRNVLRLTENSPTHHFHTFPPVLRAKFTFINFVPFGEVPGDNFRFKYIQVIQVNIFRSLVLAPLPHTFTEIEIRLSVLYSISLHSLLEPNQGN